MDEIKKYTHKEYEDVAARIRNNSEEIIDDDKRVIQDLRLSYKEPVGKIFNEIERLALSIDKDSICTYRIKRIESIISKIIRYKKMQLNRMDDVAGCRCILKTTEDVYRLCNKIEKEAGKVNSIFEIKGDIQDKITQPKPSGYKSIHIIVALKGDKRRVEIQLRSQEQHNWATLVEITDQIYGTRLKEEGDKHNPDLYEFHQLLSKSSNELSIKEKKKIVDIAAQYEYIEKICSTFSKNYLDVREKWYGKNFRKNNFFLISIDKTATPVFQGYNSFDEAEKEYYDLFINNRENKNIVLTSLRNCDFSKISKAYSNYIMTYNGLFYQILRYLSELVIYEFENVLPGAFKRFYKYYTMYAKTIAYYADNQNSSIKRMGDVIKQNTQNIIEDKEWIDSIKDSGTIIIQIITETENKMKLKYFHLFSWLYKRILDKKIII